MTDADPPATGWTLEIGPTIYHSVRWPKPLPAGGELRCVTCYQTTKTWADEEERAVVAREILECSEGEPFCETFLTEDCTCGHLLRHHGVAYGHPGCYSPGCKCMAAELVEDSDD